MKKFMFIVLAVCFWVTPACSVMFNVTGVQLDINVKQGTTKIAHNTGIYDFGTLDTYASSSPIEFTIENLCTMDINLTGMPIIEITGSDSSEFFVDSALTEIVITPGGITTFTVTFSPTSEGAKSAVVSIANDTSTNPYLFTITGTANPISDQAEINVKQGMDDIPNQFGSFDFGDVPTNITSSEITFSIENLGTMDLNLTGMPLVEIFGIDAAMFILNQTSTMSPVAPFSNTTFSIIFSPASEGVKSATISIASDDADENPYTFEIFGNGTAPADAPEINVKQGTIDIPSSAGTFDFGRILTGESSTAIIFTIENLGNIDLNLAGTPNLVNISGADAGMFLINQIMTNTPVPVGFPTTFTVVFRPTSVGAKTATISIDNDDVDENPYTFSLTGTCVTPEINIKQGTADIPNVTGTFDFGHVGTNSPSASVIFTIENVGSGDLRLTTTPIVSKTGSDPSMFAINQSSTSTPVSPGNTTSFSVIFTPTSTGLKSTVITIANNDTDENPYMFRLTGNGILPCDAVGWFGGNSNGWKTTNGASAANYFQSMRYPVDICIDNAGYMYIADTSNHRITKWDRNGNAVGWIGGGSNGWKSLRGPGNYGNDYQSFYNPYGVALDASGNIYVADTYNHRICKWDRNGNAIGWIGGATNGWSTSRGSFYSTDYQSFNFPYGVAVNSAGNIYVAEYGNHRVSRWNSSGTATGWIGGGVSGWKTTDGANPGRDYQSFYRPSGIFIDIRGIIYVSEYTNNRISKWYTNGTCAGWIGHGSNGWQFGNSSGNYGTDYQSFRYPFDVWVNRSGSIYVADYYNHRVCKWDSRGTAIGWLGGGHNGWNTTSAPGNANDYQSFYRPRGVCGDSSGNIYVADSYNHRICKWDD